MPKFKIQETRKTMLVEIYEVEAASEQEAIELYCSELAGSIEPVNYWYRDINNDEDEDVTIYKK